jgi:hypothetical protein
MMEEKGSLDVWENWTPVRGEMPPQGMSTCPGSPHCPCLLGFDAIREGLIDGVPFLRMSIDFNALVRREILLPTIGLATNSMDLW